MVILPFLAGLGACASRDPGRLSADCTPQYLRLTARTGSSGPQQFAAVYFLKGGPGSDNALPVPNSDFSEDSLSVFSILDIYNLRLESGDHRQIEAGIKTSQPQLQVDQHVYVLFVGAGSPETVWDSVEVTDLLQPSELPRQSERKSSARRDFVVMHFY